MLNSFHIVICLGGLYHVCDFWGQEKSVVDRICQLLLGKVMEALNLNLKGGWRYSDSAFSLNRHGNHVLESLVTCLRLHATAE